MQRFPLPPHSRTSWWMDGRMRENNKTTCRMFTSMLSNQWSTWATEAAPPAWTRSLDLQDLHQASTITTKTTKVFAEPADGSISTQLLHQQRRTKRTQPREIKTRHFENRFRFYQIFLSQLFPSLISNIIKEWKTFVLQSTPGPLLSVK